MRKKPKMEKNGGYRRWYDKMWNIMVALVGAMSVILWGIVWSGLTNAQARVGTLEGDNKAVVEHLKSMDRKLDRIETALERRNP